MLFTTPKGDNRPRHHCESCGAVFYENPKIVAGCIPVWKDSVLMCKRAIEPRYGLWTLPAGFMENGESTLEAAERETRNPALYSKQEWFLLSNRVFTLQNGGQT